MTGEQRAETVKQAKAMGEKAKISIRNVRKDANDKVKKLEKDKEITEDESKRAHDEVQKITDSFVKNVDDILKDKEAEILKV
jgi:ribosome recycling factor